LSGPLHAVVLAAGSAGRFGGRKLLAPWQEGVLLDGALAAAFAAPVDRVTVATGADADAVHAAARAFADARPDGARLRVVHAANYSGGLSQSLGAAIAALPPDSAGAFVFLGDMPDVPHAVLPPLAEALAVGAKAAAPFYRGRRGHPVLFAASLLPELMALEGDQGARAVLDRLGPALARIEAPSAGVLLDIDTPSQLAAATNRGFAG